MELSQAIQLIEKGVAATPNQQWADLGAGQGFFSQALAQLLPSGSITAIDQDIHALNAIVWKSDTVALTRLPADFSTYSWQRNFNGFLIANALHYVPEQATLLKRLKKQLLPDGRILVIEYDTEISNAWVPYPISFKKLQAVAAVAGLPTVTFLHRVNSTYQTGGIYAARLT
ncbi:MAG: methyltransferase domain-containing protein [Cyclobacteriaceae bacterium]|nr:methyltransferase domain-containing protein [Cyclobacteriaceae bacterium]